MIVDGPYRVVRHPMYSAALSIALGLACLIQSGACFAVFCIYLALILPLIPVEEAEVAEGLRLGVCNVSAQNWGAASVRALMFPAVRRRGGPCNESPDRVRASESEVVLSRHPRGVQREA